MKSVNVLFTALTLMVFTSAYTQKTNRGDICQSIPDLTVQQQQEIKTLESTHQQKMDKLRVEFRAESNAQSAADLKTQMNSEMQDHYQNVTAILTPEQKTWYNQTCNANGNRNYFTREAYGRGYGRGQGTRCRARFARETGYARGAGYGQGRGRGRLY